MSDVKRIDIAQFRSLGFVQEINRRILHPCGLALEVNVDEDGTETLGGVWDYRDDPEGMLFGADMIEPEKVAQVDALMVSHADVRTELMGSNTQPVDWTPVSDTAALLPDERDDLAAGCHYEREAAAGSDPTCICGVPWICPTWIEQVIANDDA